MGGSATHQLAIFRIERPWPPSKGRSRTSRRPKYSIRILKWRLWTEKVINSVAVCIILDICRRRINKKHQICKMHVFDVIWTLKSIVRQLNVIDDVIRLQAAWLAARPRARLRQRLGLRWLRGQGCSIRNMAYYANNIVYVQGKEKRRKDSSLSYSAF